MAAAQSPWGSFETRVLHFRFKKTLLKNRKWKDKDQSNAQFSFCGGREAFHQENRPLRNSTLFSLWQSAWPVLKPRQQSFCWIFRYILRSMAKEIAFLKGNVCILYILYIFLFGAKEN